MSEILEDLGGVICHMDDILIHAADQAEHDKRVRAVLGRIQEAGLTMNTVKCQFSRSSLTFLGHIVDGSGIQADPQKTTAVKNFPTPTTVSRVLGKTFISCNSYKDVARQNAVGGSLQPDTRGARD